MSRTRIAVVAFALAALLAAGCNTTGKPAKSNTGTKEATTTATNGGVDKNGMKTFKDPDGLFTVKHPAGWFANGASSLAVEMSPMRSNTNMRSARDMSVPSVEIVSGLAKENTTSLDTSDTIDRVVDALIKAKPAATRSPVHKILIDGVPGSWVSVDMAAKTGEQVKVFVALGANGRKRVEMFGYSPPDQWAANVKTFKAIAESLKFNNPKT